MHGTGRRRRACRPRRETLLTDRYQQRCPLLLAIETAEGYGSSSPFRPRDSRLCRGEAGTECQTAPAVVALAKGSRKIGLPTARTSDDSEASDAIQPVH